MTPTPTAPSLDEAIASVQSAKNNLAAATTAQQGAQTTFDQAQAAKTSADAQANEAKSVFNSSLDSLVAAATASKLS